jgi:hypothetical protein
MKGRIQADGSINVHNIMKVALGYLLLWLSVCGCAIFILII